MTRLPIDCGDHVHHGPSGEDWLVAYVHEGRLAPSGWPACLAALSDCTLIRRASEEEFIQHLREWADNVCDEHRRDLRHLRSVARLKEIGEALP